VWPPEEVTCNGAIVPFAHEAHAPSWRYEGDELMLVISLPRFSMQEKVEVRITTAEEQLAHGHLLDGVRGKLARLRRVMPWLNQLWPQEWSPEEVIRAAQTGRRMSLQPKSALHELKELEQSCAAAAAAIANLHADKRIRGRALRHLRAE
jgi:hypothetical protein